MSTWAGIELGDYNLVEWQNTYHQWLFSDSDRIREVNDNRSFIGFRLSADKLKRRLELRGVNRESVEMELKELKSLWIDNIQSFCDDFGDSEQKHCTRYTNYLNGLQESSLDSWLKLIPIAKNCSFEQKENKAKLTNTEKNLLEFIRSDYDEHPHYTAGSFHFPCFTTESYAWFILNLNDANAVCELDISGLIDSGWVDDFEDIAEYQAGQTRFFESASHEVNEIVNLGASNQSNYVLQRLTYSGLIAILEAYLSDVAKRQVLNREAIKRRFVEKFLPFSESKKKISISELYKTFDQLDNSIIDCVNNLSFHNVKTINSFYTSVLLIELPSELTKSLTLAVQNRHDIVHRAGKTTEGKNVEITNQAVKELSGLVLTIMESVDRQVVDGLLES